jgi:hypothetical protein
VGTLGVLQDGYREVSQGLKPDDLVVVTGLQKLRKNTPISAREFNPEKDALPNARPAAAPANPLAAVENAPAPTGAGPAKAEPAKAEPTKADPAAPAR